MSAYLHSDFFFFFLHIPNPQYKISMQHFHLTFITAFVVPAVLIYDVLLQGSDNHITAHRLTDIPENNIEINGCLQWSQAQVWFLLLHTGSLCETEQPLKVETVRSGGETSQWSTLWMVLDHIFLMGLYGVTP